METKSAEWIEAAEGRIKDAWDLFDKDKTDKVVQEEVERYPVNRSLKVARYSDLFSNLYSY
jgi:hypothetical protein